MKIDRVTESIREAREFIRRAEIVVAESKKVQNFGYTLTGKKSAGLRRQSMELTRALSYMRRPEL